MRQAIVLLGGMLGSACLLAGCTAADRPATSLVLSGSRSMTPMLTDIAKRFEERHPDTRVNVESTSGDRPIHDTRLGLADLGMLGRPLRPEESGLHAFAIAHDGLAIIVHRGNPVHALRDEQIVGIFIRSYINWKEVGGLDVPIVLAGQGEGRAAREIFLAHFHLQPQQVRADPTVSGGDQSIAAVAKHPSAIGYASIGPARKAMTTLPIKVLPLQGVPATLDNVRAGRYPLVRPLQLLTREEPIGAVKDFLDFSLSAEVHDLIAKHGFVP